METMTLERPSDISDTAPPLAPESCSEQLELNIGLPDTVRRLLNSNVIRRMLAEGVYVSPDASNPLVCGAETARAAAFARRRNTNQRS